MTTLRDIVVVDEDINWNHAEYMLGKLSEVCYTLATDEGDARARLRSAAPRLFAVSPGMLPESCDIRRNVEWAQASLTRYPGATLAGSPSGPERRWDPTLNRIRNLTAAKIAKAVYAAWLDLDMLVTAKRSGNVEHVESGRS